MQMTIWGSLQIMSLEAYLKIKETLHLTEALNSGSLASVNAVLLSVLFFARSRRSLTKSRSLTKTFNKFHFSLLSVSRLSHSH